MMRGSTFLHVARRNFALLVCSSNCKTCPQEPIHRHKPAFSQISFPRPNPDSFPTVGTDPPLSFKARESWKFLEEVQPEDILFILGIGEWQRDLKHGDPGG